MSVKESFFLASLLDACTFDSRFCSGKDTQIKVKSLSHSWHWHEGEGLEMSISHSSQGIRMLKHCTNVNYNYVHRVCGYVLIVTNFQTLPAFRPFY